MKDGQLLIFGNKKHPEIIGLNGHIQSKAIIIDLGADGLRGLLARTLQGHELCRFLWVEWDRPF